MSTKPRSVALLASGIFLLPTLLTACSVEVPVEPTATATQPAQVVEFGELGAEGCQPPSPVVGNEIQGTGVGSTTAYGLLQVIDPAALSVGEPIKLVLRMTGEGDLSVNLVAPDSSIHHLDWGPEAHSVSNFNRPGQEWGIGFSLETAGCWAVEARRDSGKATFWLMVAETRK